MKTTTKTPLTDAELWSCFSSHFSRLASCTMEGLSLANSLTTSGSRLTYGYLQTEENGHRRLDMLDALEKARLHLAEAYDLLRANGLVDD